MEASVPWFKHYITQLCKWQISHVLRKPPPMAQLVVSWYTLGSFSLKLILSTRNYSGRGPIMFPSSPLVSRRWTCWGLEESIEWREIFMYGGGRWYPENWITLFKKVSTFEFAYSLFNLLDLEDGEHCSHLACYSFSKYLLRTNFAATHCSTMDTRVNETGSCPGKA